MARLELCIEHIYMSDSQILSHVYCMPPHWIEVWVQVRVRVRFVFVWLRSRLGQQAYQIDVDDAVVDADDFMAVDRQAHKRIRYNVYNVRGTFE